MKAEILNYNFATDLLEHLVFRKTCHTKLIICSSREDFLNQIGPTLLSVQPSEIPASQESLDHETHSIGSPPHHLLVPTLRLLAGAQRVKLAFCPTIDSLRAFLASYVAPKSTHEPSCTTTLSCRAIWVILDLILLHHATSEFSVQGLSRTLACAVEAASRSRVDLLLNECKDVHDTWNPDRGPRLWHAEVPLLSGSLRIGSEGSGFANRVIPVRRIAERWFVFERNNAQNEGRLDLDRDDEILM